MPSSSPAPGPLSRERVARAAMQLVDEAGFDQLTLRGLARRLGISAPSLYEHVASKDDLIDLVVAQILAEAARGWNPPEEWDEAVRYAARWWYRMLGEHMAVHDSVLRRPMAAPVALDAIQTIIGALISAGFGHDQASATYALIFRYVVGAAALARSRAASRATRHITQDEEQRRTEQLLERLDPDKYPALITARAALARTATDEVFEAGLDAIIMGLRQRSMVSGSTSGSVTTSDRPRA